MCNSRRVLSTQFAAGTDPAYTSASSQADDTARHRHAHTESRSQTDFSHTLKQVSNRDDSDDDAQSADKKQDSKDKADKPNTTATSDNTAAQQPVLKLSGLLGLLLSEPGAKTNTPGKTSKKSGTTTDSTDEEKHTGKKEDARQSLTPQALTVPGYTLPLAWQQFFADGREPEGTDTNSNSIESTQTAALEAGNSKAPNAATATAAADPLAFTMLVSSQSGTTQSDNAADSAAAAAAPVMDAPHAVTNLTSAVAVQAVESTTESTKSDAQPNGMAAAWQEQRAQASSDGPAPIEKASATQASDLDANVNGGRTELVRNVHIQLETENNQRVDLRMSDQGSGLRVSVRAADSNLAQALQDHMPELTNRLEQQHFRAEVWIPRTAETSDSNGANARGFHSPNGQGGSQDGSGRRHNGNQQHQPDWYEDETRPQARNQERTNQIWDQ